MGRSELFIVGGVTFLLGIGVGYVVTPSAPPAPSPVAPPELVAELTQARERIATLEQEVQAARSPVSLSTPAVTPTPLAPSVVAPTELSRSAPGVAPTSAPAKPDRIAWRISAIEKFVPLNAEQRARLQVKFEREAAGEPTDAASESLEAILGEESARFYRAQVNEAFKRARDEEVDREVVWLGRQLALSPDQEQRVKVAFDEVEVAVDTGALPESVNAATGAERVKAMIAENRRREELRAARLKEILSADQFTAYSRVRADSTSSDLEVFHGAE